MGHISPLESRGPRSLVRDSWRPYSMHGTQARIARLIRRLVLTAITLLLLAALLYLLLRPFVHPNTYFVFFVANDTTQITPQTYTLEDYAYLDPLTAAVTQPPDDDSPLPIRPLQTPAELEQQLLAIDQWRIGHGEALIIYFKAHGLVIDGEPHLVCDNFHPRLEPEGVFPVSTLLQHVRNYRAGTKLVVIDTGQCKLDRRLGTLGNDFPHVLEQVVAETNDPDLWVLHSHSNLQSAQTSRALGRSVFGFMFARGLKGGADINNDRLVSLDELTNYVKLSVDQWSRDYGTGVAIQSPQLFHAAADGSEPASYPLLVSVANIPAEAREEDIAEAMTTAQSPQRQSELSRSIQEHMAYFVEERKRRLASAFAPDMRTEEFLLTARKTAKRQVANGDEKPIADDPQASTDPADDESSESAASEESPPQADAELDADSVELNLQHVPIVADLLSELWSIRDQQFTTKGFAPRIADYAPDLWSEFEWELLIAEQRHRSGLAANQIALAEQLRDLKASLEVFNRGESPRRRRQPNVIDRAIARRPEYDPRGEQINSLALAEVLAGYGNPLTEAEQEAIASFREAIAADSREKFDEWLASPAVREIDHFYEVDLAKQLGTQLELPWALIQLAINTRLLSEQVVATPTVDAAWFQHEIDPIDTIRLGAERMLIDRIGTDWERHAWRDLNQAAEEYRAAGRRVTTLRELIRLRRDLLLQARHYVHWRGMINGDQGVPSHADVSRLLTTLAETSELLERPEPRNLPRLFRLHESLSQLNDRLSSTVTEQSLQDLIDNPIGGDAARLDAMLSTPLLAAPLRELAATNAVSVEGRLMAEFEVTIDLIKLGQLARLTNHDWERFVMQAKLELQLAELAILDSDTKATQTAKLRTQIEAIEQQSSAVDGMDIDTVFAAHRSLADGIAAIYFDLPNRIRRTMLASADLSSLATRNGRLSNLLAAQRGLSLLDPRDTQRVEGGTLIRSVIAARWYDHLAWQNQRMLSQLADAPHHERSYLVAAAERYRRIAAEIPAQPTLPEHNPPSIELNGPDFVSLASVDAEQAVIQLRKRASTSDEVWWLLDYDPNLIEVRTAADRVIYRRDDIAPRIRAQADEAAAKQRMMALSTAESPQFETLANSTAMIRAARYPVRPNLADYPRSIAVAAGNSTELSLQIKRLAGKASDAKLLVKAVTAGSYVRHEIVVRLPGRETLELTSLPERDDWAATSRGLMLHPMPNRATEFPLFLKNHGSRARAIDLQWFAPESRVVAVLPAGEQTPDVAEQILDRLGKLTPWQQLNDLVLPPGGKPVPLIASPPPAGDNGSAPTSAAQDVTQTSGETPPGQLLDHGLLAVLTDRDSGKVSMRLLEFAPQRPRRYVEPMVSYNSTTQQIEVEVKPLNRFAIGPQGIPVELSFAEPLPPGAEARLEGVITTANPVVRLFADVPPDYRRRMTAYINVDSYPRAFVFDVPIGIQSRDIPEQTDLFQVTIDSPEDRAAFKSPLASVPVTVRVDAPRGSFPPDYTDDLVEIGIDIDRDREFRDEQTYPFHSDRLVAVTATGLLPNGALRVNTKITDFTIDLPTDGLSNTVANLLARVRVGEFVKWSESVPIILDGSPPRVERIEMNPGRSVEADKELEVSVWGADANLSGMAKVEIGFGSQSGDFAPMPPPVEAEPIANVRWSGTLKLKGLEPGLHTVLIRTTDAVGNVSKMHKESIQIVPAGSVPTEVETKKGATISGVVMYGDAPLDGADVELVPLDEAAEKIEPIQADEEGRFRFRNVAPGKYTLNASRLARNKLRKTSVEVTVEEGDTGLQLFTLQPR